MGQKNKEKIEKLKQELLIMKSLKIEPNYAELSRIYKIDRRTIEKYNNGYSKENCKMNKKSRLDKYKDEIIEKLELPGITITGLYQYLNESLFYYKGKRYSVPPKFIGNTLAVQENNNKLYLYYNKELITIHDISEKNINYKQNHYIEGLSGALKSKSQEQIEE